MNPSTICLRESRDSTANPESTAIIICPDLTGSMGFILDYFAKEGLGNLCTGIYDKLPVSDPHIMLMGVGDVHCDEAPLQVSQFEAEVGPLLEQIEALWVHHGGGGNGSESYTLPWFFAATRTGIDCFEKRQKKGYLFTIGDEPINESLSKNHVARVMGKVSKADFRDFSAAELLEKVSEKYHVVHLIAEEGTNGKYKQTHESWVKVLGENVIHMKDHKKMAEIIISTMFIKEGMDPEAAAEKWDNDTAKAIKTAVNFRT